MIHKNNHKAYPYVSTLSGGVQKLTRHGIIRLYVCNHQKLLAMSPHFKDWRDNPLKALIIYDSFFGNTEQIAQAIGHALGSSDEIQTLRVGVVNPEKLTGVDLLIVGSPTRGFRPSPAISDFLKGIPKNGLTGSRVASFDTRFTEQEIKASAKILPFLVNIFGYAAKPIADGLIKKGGELIAPPEGFYVKGTEGPLLEGELIRAEEWAKGIITKLLNQAQ